jgi:hypothetical protein
MFKKIVKGIVLYANSTLYATMSYDQKRYQNINVVNVSILERQVNRRNKATAFKMIYYFH